MGIMLVLRLIRLRKREIKGFLLRKLLLWELLARMSTGPGRLVGLRLVVGILMLSMKWRRLISQSKEMSKLK